MRMAADKGLTTPALMVNGFGCALLMTTQGDHHLARKGSLALLQRLDQDLHRPVSASAHLRRQHHRDRHRLLPARPHPRRPASARYPGDLGRTMKPGIPPLERRVPRTLRLERSEPIHLPGFWEGLPARS